MAFSSRYGGGNRYYQEERDKLEVKFDLHELPTVLSDVSTAFVLLINRGGTAAISMQARIRAVNVERNNRFDYSYREYSYIEHGIDTATFALEGSIHEVHELKGRLYVDPHIVD